MAKKKTNRIQVAVPLVIAALAGALFIAIGTTAVEPEPLKSTWTMENHFTGHTGPNETVRHTYELRMPNERAKDGLFLEANRPLVTLREGPTNQGDFRVVLTTMDNEVIIDRVFIARALPGQDPDGPDHAGHDHTENGSDQAHDDEPEAGTGTNGDDGGGGHDGHEHHAHGPSGAFLSSGRYFLYVEAVDPAGAHYELAIRSSFTLTTSSTGALIDKQSLIVPGAVLLSGSAMGGLLTLLPGRRQEPQTSDRSADPKTTLHAPDPKDGVPTVSIPKEGHS